MKSVASYEQKTKDPLLNMLKTANSHLIFFKLLRSFVKNDYFCTRIQKSIHFKRTKL